MPNEVNLLWSQEEIRKGAIKFRRGNVFQGAHNLKEKDRPPERNSKCLEVSQGSSRFLS